MQKILISGHNPTFKNNFMNSLQFKKTVVTLDGYDGAVKSSHINYYDYFRRYNDEQLIELIKNLLYVHEIPHAEIIFVENYTESGKTVELPRDYKLYGTDQTVNSIKLAPFGIALLSDLTKV